MADFDDDLANAAQASEEIRDALGRIDDAANALLASGLTERALIVLLRDLTQLKGADIRAVLRALPRLRDFVEQDQHND